MQGNMPPMKMLKNEDADIINTCQLVRTICLLDNEQDRTDCLRS